MENELSLMQNVQLNILKEFIGVCDKLNLRYYLIEGSMLGAKRHQGFIPWDDDIDVGMPRKDYEIFCTEANKYLKAPYYLSTIADNNHIWMTAILFDKSRNVVLNNASEAFETYAWIDVIPLDGTPANKVMQRLHYYHYFMYRALYQLSHFSKIVNVNRQRPWYEKMVINIACKIKIENKLNSVKISQKLHTILAKYDFDKCRYVASHISDYKLKEIMPRIWYGNGKKYKFQDTEVMGVSNSQKYLAQLYGDYMKLPPENQRIGKHNAKIVD